MSSWNEFCTVRISWDISDTISSNLTSTLTASSRPSWKSSLHKNATKSSLSTVIPLNIFWLSWVKSSAKRKNLSPSEKKMSFRFGITTVDSIGLATILQTPTTRKTTEMLAGFCTEWESSSCLLTPGKTRLKPTKMSTKPLKNWRSKSLTSSIMMVFQGPVSILSWTNCKTKTRNLSKKLSKPLWKGFLMNNLTQSKAKLTNTVFLEPTAKSLPTPILKSTSKSSTPLVTNVPTNHSSSNFHTTLTTFQTAHTKWTVSVRKFLASVVCIFTLKIMAHIWL